jgi:hypothetical protein
MGQDECFGAPLCLGRDRDGESSSTAACPGALPAAAADASSVAEPADSAPSASPSGCASATIGSRGLAEDRDSTREREEAPMPTTPQVGRRARDFTLTDTRGEKIRLSDYRGEKNVLLVFNRGFV